MEASSVFKQLRQESKALTRLLIKNKSQHRRGKYYKQLWMLNKALERVVKQFSWTNPSIAEELVGETIQESPLKKKVRSLSLCTLIELSGCLVVHCAGHFSALISRTHFLAFSTAVLVTLSTIRIILIRLFQESISLYNGLAVSWGKQAKDINIPFMIECVWNADCFPKFVCHYNYPSSPSSDSLASSQELDIGQQVFEEPHIDSDPEVLEAYLPIVNDGNTSTERVRKKAKLVTEVTQKPIKTKEAEKEELDADAEKMQKESTVASPSKQEKPPGGTTYLQVRKRSEAFIRLAQTPKHGHEDSGRKRKSYKTSFALMNSQTDIDDIFNMLDKPRKNK